MANIRNYAAIVASLTQYDTASLIKSLAAYNRYVPVHAARVHVDNRQYTLIDGMLMSVRKREPASAAGQFIGGYVAADGSIGLIYRFVDGREYRVPQAPLAFGLAEH